MVEGFLSHVEGFEHYTKAMEVINHIGQGNNLGNKYNKILQNFPLCPPNGRN